MRLLIAIALSSSLALLMSLATMSGPALMSSDGNGSNGSATSDGQTQTGDGAGQDQSPADGTTPLNPIWVAVGKVGFWVLLGWAVGRLLLQLRRIILLFIGLVILVDALVVLSGFVEVRFNLQQLEALFEVLKWAVVRVGFVQALSLGLGIWAGVQGVLISERRLRTAESA